MVASRLINNNRRLNSLGRSSWRGWLSFSCMRISWMDKAGRTSLVEMCITSRMMLDKISGRSRRWLSNLDKIRRRSRRWLNNLDKISGRRLNRIRRRKWLNKSQVGQHPRPTSAFHGK